MSLPRYWTWDYEIRKLGCWPTRPPYAGHAEPVEIVKLADVRALVEPELQALRFGFETFLPDSQFVAREAIKRIDALLAALKETPC